MYQFWPFNQADLDLSLTSLFTFIFYSCPFSFCGAYETSSSFFIGLSVSSLNFSYFDYYLSPLNLKSLTLFLQSLAKWPTYLHSKHCFLSYWIGTLYCCYYCCFIFWSLDCSKLLFFLRIFFSFSSYDRTNFYF